MVVEEEEKSPDDDGMDFQIPDLSDEASIDAGEDSDKKKSKKRLKLSKKQIVIISAAAATLLLLIIVAVIVMKVMAGDSSEEAKAAADKKVASIPLPLPEVVNILPLEPFKIPLSDDLGDWELNITISLEVPQEAVQKEIERRSKEIREALTSILGKRSPNMLQSVTEKIALRTELIAKINQMLKKGKIKNLYFTEFVVM